ncbi:hypothetical protein TNCV_1509231 [Trichonephila clavipes]|nr:hypothetical protein TNCV_1509231 [Trichonephila clavipes]
MIRHHDLDSSMRELFGDISLADPAFYKSGPSQIKKIQGDYQIWHIYRFGEKTLSGQDNVRPHVVKTVRDFCSVQRIHLLPWPAYSPDMSPIEHVWDLVGRRLARVPRPAASKDMEFFSTSRHSKSVRLQATSYSSTYCSAW